MNLRMIPQVSDEPEDEIVAVAVWGFGVFGVVWWWG